MHSLSKHRGGQARGAGAGAAAGSLPSDDVTLRDRAESILFRDPKVPKGTINISAERGTLVLRGEVPNARMRNKLAREAEKIEGVWGVENLLHLPGEAGDEPELTGAATS